MKGNISNIKSNLILKYEQKNLEKELGNLRCIATGFHHGSVNCRRDIHAVLPIESLCHCLKGLTVTASGVLSCIIEIIVNHLVDKYVAELILRIIIEVANFDGL